MRKYTNSPQFSRLSCTYELNPLNIYLVNNSEYDIERVFTEKDEMCERKEYGSFMSKERLLLGGQEYWEFDWATHWDVNLQFDTNNTMKIYFEVPYGGCKQKPYKITVSDQNPFDWLKDR